MGFRHGAALWAVVRAGPIDMAVAYWGHRAGALVDLPASLGVYSIICDARSGFCSPIALGALLTRGARIVDLLMLHAKVYRNAGGMVVASSNVSARGLPNGDDTPGLKAGCLVEDPVALAAAAHWFEEALALGAPIGPDDIIEIAALWDRQRRDRPLRTSLIETLLHGAAGLADRSLQVLV